MNNNDLSLCETWTWVAVVNTPNIDLAERIDKLILRAMMAGIGEWSGAPMTCSRTQIQRWIEEGHVSINGSTAISRSQLSAGDRVIVAVPPSKAPSITAEELPLDFLYQDSHIAVVNKPQGISVHPSVTETGGTLVNALLHHVKDLSGVGGELRPGIVHRLDKNTSGALVISKTDDAHRTLAGIFSRHEIERRYWALCYAAPRLPSGKIDTLIGRNPTDRKKMSEKVKTGRRAITRYRVLAVFDSSKGKKRSPFASLIEVTLETGRTHQVRVHLTSIGCSLLGDPVYGTPTERQNKWLSLPEKVRACVLALPGQALHARVLGFKHPVTGAPLYFEAPPPELFLKLLATLREFELPNTGAPPLFHDEN